MVLFVIFKPQARSRRLEGRLPPMTALRPLMPEASMTIDLVIRVDHHIVRKVDRFILQLRQMVEIVFLLLKIEGGAQVFHRACRFGDGAADEIVEQRARVAELIAVAKGEGEGAAS